MSTDNRVPAGVPAGGQFTASARGEASTSLGAQAAPVQVHDRRGDAVTLTPGVLDGEARYVYSSGQCLAMAVAMAEKTGWDVYVRVGHDRVGRRKNSTDYCIHALVQTPDGDCIDVQGVRAPGDWVESGKEVEPVLVPASEARTLLDRFAIGMPPQDVEVAATFVDPVLDAHGVEALPAVSQRGSAAPST